MVIRHTPSSDLPQLVFATATSEIYHILFRHNYNIVATSAGNNSNVLYITALPHNPKKLKNLVAKLSIAVGEEFIVTFMQPCKYSIPTICLKRGVNKPKLVTSNG